MIKCEKCGADIDDNQPKCEYCGWMNYPAAENEYFDKLESIRDKMQTLETAPEKAYASDIKKIKSNIIFSVAGVLIVIALIVLFDIYF